MHKGMPVQSPIFSGSYTMDVSGTLRIQQVQSSSENITITGSPLKPDMMPRIKEDIQRDLRLKPTKGVLS